MIVEIKNKELAKTLKELAYQENMNVDELVEQLLTFSLDHSISTLALKRIEYFSSSSSNYKYACRHP